MRVKQKPYEPAPAGVHQGVCVDCVDLGTVESSFGPREMLKIVWELEALRSNGYRFLIQRRFTASLHKQSSLHKLLKTWFGRALTKEECSDFDMENLIGRSCTLVVIHADVDGTVYANVDNCLPPGKDPLPPSGKYARTQQSQAATVQATEEVSSGEVPF